MPRHGMIVSGLGILLEELDGFLVVQKVRLVCVLELCSIVKPLLSDSIRLVRFTGFPRRACLGWQRASFKDRPRCRDCENWRRASHGLNAILSPT